MQPATVVVADIEAIRLRQFVQYRFEENDCAVNLAPVKESNGQGPLVADRVGLLTSAKANLAPFAWHSSRMTLAKLRL